MNDILAGLATLAGAAAIVGLAAWAIASMRSTKRFDGRQHGTSGSLGNAFLEVQALLEPEKRHALEERRVEEREEDGTDAPPRPGSGASGASEP